jgi:hypothetical protein
MALLPLIAGSGAYWRARRLLARRPKLPPP